MTEYLGLKQSTLARLKAIAESEYRELEGQILAMCEQWEKSYGVKASQIPRAIEKPQKPAALKVVSGSSPAPKTRKTMSPETREKIRQSRVGKKHSEETKRKISQAKKGVKLSKDIVEKRAFEFRMKQAKDNIKGLRQQIKNLSK